MNTSRIIEINNIYKDVLCETIQNKKIELFEDQYIEYMRKVICFLNIVNNYDIIAFMIVFNYSIIYLDIINIFKGITIKINYSILFFTFSNLSFFCNKSI
jgi:hypothetical protein